MAELGGIWNRLPLFAFFLILASMGSIALPGLNGFVGEFPILVGAFRRDRVAALFAATGMVLGAYYLLSMVQKVAFGPLKEPSGHDADHHGSSPEHHESGHPPIRPIGWHEIAGLGPIMVLIVAIGVYPKPFLDRIIPTIRPIVARKFGGTRPEKPSPSAPTTASNSAKTLAAANPRFETRTHD